MNGLTALLQTQVVVFNPKLTIPIAVRWEHRPKPWEQKINTFGGLKPWITTSEIRFKSNETDLCISVKLSHTCSSEPWKTWKLIGNSYQLPHPGCPKKCPHLAYKDDAGILACRKATKGFSRWTSQKPRVSEVFREVDPVIFRATHLCHNNRQVAKNASFEAESEKTTAIVPNQGGSIITISSNQ